MNTNLAVKFGVFCGGLNVNLLKSFYTKFMIIFKIFYMKRIYIKMGNYLIIDGNYQVLTISTVSILKSNVEKILNKGGHFHDKLTFNSSVILAKNC